MRKSLTVDPLKDIKSSHGRELAGRRVVLCVTGSVASIEVPHLARELMRHGAEVNIVLSEAAERLVRPETLEWATGNPVIRKLTGRTEHVRLAGGWPGRAHVVVVAPCTANTISKLALGIDDTPVTTVASMALGSGIPLVLCPAAHEPMYHNPAVEANLNILRQRGIEIVEPTSEEGKAKMASVDQIVGTIARRFTKQDLSGKGILITGGPTVEFIDPVRVITNLSSGRTGLALAVQARNRGADVCYIFGGSLYPPSQIRSRHVRTGAEMMEAVVDELATKKYDAFISAGAPSDFIPVEPAASKIQSDRETLTVDMKPAPKIIGEVKKRWPGIFLVAFKAETVGSDKELLAKMREFREKSGSDIVVGNDVSRGKGFGTETNSVIILGRKTRRVNELPKDGIATEVLDAVASELVQMKADA